MILVAIALGVLAGARGRMPPAEVGSAPRTAAADPDPSPLTPSPGAGAAIENGAAPQRTPEPQREPAIGRPIDVSALAEQVSAIRGLPLLRPLDARAVTVEELATVVRRLAFAEVTDAELAAHGDLLVALRLAPPGTDLRVTLDRLLSEQVVGVYDPDADVLYVPGDPDRLSPFQRQNAAHEVLHALVDQHFDIGAIRRPGAERADAALARAALVEGDAVRLTARWAAAHQSQQERQAALGEAAARTSPALAESPKYVGDSLLFPYREGLVFVDHVAATGPGALDAVYRSPPWSTEHVLHPDRFLAGEQVRAAPQPPAAGTGWEEVLQIEFGEFDLRAWLEPLGGDTASAAADGWGGGRIAGWRRGAQRAVALSLVFDDADEARQACAAIPQWYSRAGAGAPVGQATQTGDRDAFAQTCSGPTVMVGLAPDGATASRLAGGAG